MIERSQKRGRAFLWVSGLAGDKIAGGTSGDRTKPNRGAAIVISDLTVTFERGCEGSDGESTLEKTGNMNFESRRPL